MYSVSHSIVLYFHLHFKVCSISQLDTSTFGSCTSMTYKIVFWVIFCNFMSSFLNEINIRREHVLCAISSILRFYNRNPVESIFLVINFSNKRWFAKFKYCTSDDYSFILVVYVKSLQNIHFPFYFFFLLKYWPIYYRYVCTCCILYLLCI